MSFSRRKFIRFAASASALAVAPGKEKVISLLTGDVGNGYRPEFLPTEKEIWDWEVWMAKLGPKYTGNKAHTQFVEFLASQLQSLGLDLARDHYTLPRWEARRWEITITPASGKSFKAPVTSYFPYSGQTSAEGVTGDLFFAGTAPTFDTSNNVQGKVAFIECPVPSRPYSEWYKPWGLYPSSASFPSVKHSAAVQSAPTLTDFQKSGALGVILGWTDISDANAADQYAPFSRPLQNIPGLWVGHETTAKLRELAKVGAKATVVLEADIIPDTPTDTLIATLPGMSSDEVIIVNTHTDGPNATEENGGVGVLALAKYFSKIPKSERKRTLVFVLATGHFAGPYVPSIRGVIMKHPDLIQKAVAALTVEHLGAMDWSDDAAMQYKPTGGHELVLAMSPLKSTADIMLEALQGSEDQNVAVVNIGADGHFYGEGNALSHAGVPTIGYIPAPNYLLAGPANCCIEKINGKLMHSEIEVFAKLLHKMDSMTPAELKGV